ncbi:hypothetical protein BHF68_01635 [Desulfuribacillus alkaliarsenatis]|uniref:General secretion pathway GspH domain-containing protein n=1 Tax=Desulfuribacillus alkaliarsenatis TaxID=766136 RepID=A0A1E5G5G3_9FIRM|nr:hypothetical protein BHF68_01635 [Desulfuribacillus alkaliarsenatis]
MLVIVIISTIMIPVYPTVERQYQYYLLEQEAQKLATFLERSRQQAILEKRRTVVRFYVSSFPNSYGLRDEVNIVERHYLPDDISLYQNIASNNLIEFGSLGNVRPAGGTIRLTNSYGQSKEIIIHLFSGIIEVR